MDTRPGRVLPRHLLELPQIIRALAKRDFTPVFAAAKAAGLSYNAIAAACEMKTERVSLIARGSATVTSIDTVERIADGLHIPGGWSVSPRDAGRSRLHLIRQAAQETIS